MIIETSDWKGLELGVRGLFNVHVVTICSKLSSPSSLFCLPCPHLLPVTQFIVPGENRSRNVFT